MLSAFKLSSPVSSDEVQITDKPKVNQQQKNDNWSTSAATCSSGASSEGQGFPKQTMDRCFDVTGKKRQNQEDDLGPSTSDPHGDSKGNKKQRLLWTSHLHAKFIEAVKLLGVENAVPTKILQLMNEPEVTREQVASHLQKYRLHLKRMAGLPPDAPLNHQTKDLMQVTQNVMISSLPSTMMPSMLTALPLAAATAAGLQSPLLYQLPQGLASLGGMAGLQPVQLVDAKGSIAFHQQQQLMPAFAGNQLLALNVLPMNYNPYSMLVMPNMPYATMPTQPASPGRVPGSETDSDEYDAERQ